MEREITDLRERVKFLEETVGRLLTAPQPIQVLPCPCPHEPVQPQPPIMPYPGPYPFTPWIGDPPSPTLPPYPVGPGWPYGTICQTMREPVRSSSLVMH